MRKEEELLLSRALDCRERALREGFCATRFLTPEEGSLLLRRFARDPEAFSRTTDRLVALEGEQTELLQRWESVEQRLQDLGELAG